MALISLLDGQLAYGHVPLLDRAAFSLQPSERVGLVGRNGTGKSSLLKVLAGLEPMDDGLLQRQQGLRWAYVPQEPSLNAQHSIFEAVSEGLSDAKAAQERYLNPQANDDLDALHAEVERLGGWTWEQRTSETLARLGLAPDRTVGDLSGGLKKRVALARALVTQPDVLLLDEPTNHLDLASIAWLEELLKSHRGSVVVVSHDRAFLDAVTTRIVELDRGELLSYPGNFAQYQALKAEQLAQEAVINAKADKLLAQEEVWIRKGVEARRTRAQGRITRLEQLRAARAARRNAVGQVKLALDRGEASGKVVAELHAVSKHWGDGELRKTVVNRLDYTVLRGDKLALLGPNGVGKTTLLKLILGELAPDEGSVRLGSNLQVAYFDQMRDQLQLDATLEDFISPGSEWIEIGDKRTHVRSYLADFLFSPARAQAPVKTLSGGERNRLLLARLFARPANVLVLDEPTNDLDIETLELLEELLATYPGTVLLVSHDRAFVNNVVTGVLAFEGDGKWVDYEGDVNDWLTQSSRRWAAQEQAAAMSAAPSAATAPTTETKTAPAVAKRKLSYKEQRELEALPGQIEAMEAEQQELAALIADGQIFVTDPARGAQATQRHEELETLLMSALERWDQLSTPGA